MKNLLRTAALLLCCSALAFAQHSVALSWINPVQASDVTDQARKVVRTSANEGQLTRGTLGPTATSFTDTSVAAGTSYSYSVSAVTSTGEAVSSPITAVIPADPPPPQNTPATLITTASSFTFAGQSSLADPAAQSFSVGDTTPAGVHVPFTVGTDQTWLWATPDGFQTNANVSVSVRMVGLAPGTYTGHVFVAALDYSFNGSTYTFTNSPLNIPVTLTVAAAPPPPAQATMTSLGWTAAAPLKVGTTVQLKAVANYSNGTVGDVTAPVTWTSSSTARLSISTTGLATVKTAGLVTITPTIKGAKQVTTTK